MIGVLLKKQLREQFAFLYRGKKGTVRSRGGAIALFVLLAFSYFSMAFGFFGISILLGEGLIGIGMDWFFFALLAAIGFGLGLFGSVFITYNTLYKAKDNEFLLAMPIAPWKILFTRIAVLFGFTYLFEALAVIPGMLGYFVVGGFSAATLVHSLILLPATVLLTVALSCGLAYVVALIAGHIRHKQAAIVILTLAFLTVYYV
ncbi:MAG: hypothetical protein J5794_02435, partial [Lachnospiraceae bacterium]|nr:hypothetical protein [Lachnospiraceae bacterium]